MFHTAELRVDEHVKNHPGTSTLRVSVRVYKTLILPCYIYSSYNVFNHVPDNLVIVADDKKTKQKQN